MRVICPHCGAETRRSLLITLCGQCGGSLADAAPSPPIPKPMQAPVPESMDPSPTVPSQHPTTPRDTIPGVPPVARAELPEDAKQLLRRFGLAVLAAAVAVLLAPVLALIVRVLAEGRGSQPVQLPASWVDTNSGTTALQLAARRGDARNARRLLEEGANVNAADANGFTPLHDAAGAGVAQVADLLLQHGADIHARNTVEYTPLHIAAWRDDRFEVVELLLARGADVKARSDLGWTPLHNAAAGGSRRAAELLLAHGADPAARDYRGRTPAEAAMDKGHSEVADLIRSHATSG